jgi:dihydroorotase
MINGMFVRMYNAVDNRFEYGVLKKKDDKYYVDKADSCDHASGIYLTPGWIDLHAHINDGFGMFGINADEIGYKTGVCMVADAGTTGDYTIGGFRKYVEPAIKTNIRLFICISPIGIIFNHEYNALEYLNAANTVRTIEANRDVVCGVKVRIASGVIRHEGIEPLRVASEVAGITDLPLMVHIGGNPPYLSDIEPFLKKGDILTHCFNGSGDAWNEDGTPTEPLKKLIERGVVMDVGHGAGSFSFDVCRKAVLQGQVRVIKLTAFSCLLFLFPKK